MELVNEGRGDAVEVEMVPTEQPRARSPGGSQTYGGLGFRVSIVYGCYIYWDNEKWKLL